MGGGENRSQAGRHGSRETKEEVIVVVPGRVDVFRTVTLVAKIVKSGFFLEVESTRLVSGLNIRARQESRILPSFWLEQLGEQWYHRDNCRKKRVLFRVFQSRALIGKGG